MAKVHCNKYTFAYNAVCVIPVNLIEEYIKNWEEILKDGEDKRIVLETLKYVYNDRYAIKGLMQLHEIYKDNRVKIFQQEKNIKPEILSDPKFFKVLIHTNNNELFHWINYADENIYRDTELLYSILHKFQHYLEKFLLTYEVMLILFKMLHQYQM